MICHPRQGRVPAVRRATVCVVLFLLLDPLHAGWARADRDAAPGSPGPRSRPAATQPAGQTQPASDLPWFSKISAEIDRKAVLRRRLGYPEEPLAKPVSREAAHRLLLTTDTFASPAVGYEGRTTPNQVYAFAALLGQPDAAAAFQDLVRRGQPAGQLYGLCGLYLKDLTAFGREVQSFRKSDGQVRQFMGCIIMPVPVREVVESPHPNAIRLRPGQTLQQWDEEHRGEEGWHSDIIGGAWPRVFEAAAQRINGSSE